MAATRPLPSFDRERFFRRAVGFSLLAHGLFFLGIYLFRFLPKFERELIEIDLTKPFRIGGNPLLTPGGGTTLQDIKNEGPKGLLEEPAPDKEVKPKDWVIPGPETKVIEPPVAQGSPADNRSPDGIEGGTGEGYKGTGGGVGGGHGEGGGLPLSRYPKLINKEKINRLLQSNYPEVERQSGRGGTVVVDLHLDEKGQVLDVDLVGSAGSAFDEVARSVARKMRFTPAMMQDRAVAAKIRQSVIFKPPIDGE